MPFLSSMCLYTIYATHQSFPHSLVLPAILSWKPFSLHLLLTKTLQVSSFISLTRHLSLPLFHLFASPLLPQLPSIKDITLTKVHETLSPEPRGVKTLNGETTSTNLLSSPNITNDTIYSSPSVFLKIKFDVSWCHFFPPPFFQH